MLRCINTANSVLFHMSIEINQTNYGIRNIMTKCKHTVMTLISSILPGVSWRSANWTATQWYMGRNFSWRAASFFWSSAFSSGFSCGLLGFSTIWMHALSSRCIVFSRSFLQNLISTVPSGSKTPPLQSEDQKFCFYFFLLRERKILFILISDIYKLHQYACL